MKSTFVPIGLILAALIASIGLATGAAAKPGHGGCGGLEKKIERLDLSTETETAALAILDEARPGQRAMRALVREAREGLDALLEADPVDEAAVLAQADAVGALEQEAHMLRLRTLLKVQAVLSPEDRAAVLEAGKRRHR